MVVRLSCSILHKNSTLFFLVGLSFEFMKLVVIWDELMNNHQISINWILMEFEWMKWIEWQLKNISKELAFHGHPLLVDIRAADSKESATFLSLSLSFLFSEFSCCCSLFPSVWYVYLVYFGVDHCRRLFGSPGRHSSRVVVVAVAESIRTGTEDTLTEEELHLSDINFCRGRRTFLSF